jgi:hypothetical protein
MNAAARAKLTPGIIAIIEERAAQIAAALSDAEDGAELPEAERCVIAGHECTLGDLARQLACGDHEKARRRLVLLGAAVAEQIDQIECRGIYQ